MSGVYQITNTVDSRAYIGGSVNIHSRWREHKRDLSRGRHKNIHLQRFVQKYGIGQLRFNVIEICKRGSVFIREQLYIDFFKRVETPLFNISKSASAPMLGRKHSPETLKKISRPGKSNSMYGRARSKKVKDAVSFANKGRPKSKAEKVKRLASLSNRKEVIVNTKQGRFQFFSIAHAAKFLQVRAQSLSKALKNSHQCAGKNVSYAGKAIFSTDFCLRNLDSFDENIFPKEILLK